MLYTTTDSPVGQVLLVGDGAALTGLYLAEAKGAPAIRSDWRHWSAGRGDDEGFEPVLAQLAAYFAGELTAFDLPVTAVGTPFQKRVWDALGDLPYGETTSYGELARQVGGSPRAVGGALARNPVCIVVPCHRVVGSGGAVTGYAGGLDVKRRLLDLERHRQEQLALT